MTVDRWTGVVPPDWVCELARLVVGNAPPHRSGDLRARMRPAMRDEFDMVASEIQSKFDALISRAEKAERERDEERRWVDAMHQEECRTSNAIGDRFTLVPPDGGDVKTWEAATAMRAALEKAEAERDALAARVKALMAVLKQCADELDREASPATKRHYAIAGNPITIARALLAQREGGN